MFGIGFTEILVILAVAVIFIGPKDLPRLGYKLGRFLRALNLAKMEFSAQLKQAHATLEAEDRAAKQGIKDTLNPDDLLKDLNPLKGLKTEFEAFKKDIYKSPLDKSLLNKSPLPPFDKGGNAGATHNPVGATTGGRPSDQEDNLTLHATPETKSEKDRAP